MIYIISVIKNSSDSVLYYRGFDTYSESDMLLSTETLEAIIVNDKIKVVNARVENNNLAITKWPHEIDTERTVIADGETLDVHTGARYVLLASGSAKHTLVDYTGQIHTIYRLKDIVKYHNVANCTINNSGDLTAVDTYELQPSKEFERNIAEKYKIFVAKAIMLDYGAITFEYKIENHEVKIINYTGTSKTIILPPFITAIMSKAFKDKDISSLKLNEGLKSIGKKAFSNGNISYVEIPETVEFIGLGAFGKNRKLFRASVYINTDRFKLRNSKTLVLDQAI